MELLRAAELRRGERVTPREWAAGKKPPSERTARKRAERKARIISTAARLFAEHGYDNTNFDDIAEELDLRGPSLYYYFSSKEDLFRTCLSHAAEQVFARLQAIASSEEDSMTVLRELIREQVVIELRDFPEFVPLFFRSHISASALRAEILRLRRIHAEIFESVLAPLQIEPSADFRRVRVWLGITYGAFAYLREWYDPGGQLGVDEVAEIMSGTLVAALLHP